jgi:hypothetical protein
VSDSRSGAFGSVSDSPGVVAGAASACKVSANSVARFRFFRLLKYIGLQRKLQH